MKEKQIKNLLYKDKRCNSLDLELWRFKDEIIETSDGLTEQEQHVLYMMEKEINALRDSIEIWKKLWMIEDLKLRRIYNGS